jgi:hypothetical protein
MAVRGDTLWPGIRLDFRRRGGGDEKVIFWADDPLAPGPGADFKTAASRGVVGSIRFAPGDYELYNFLVHFPSRDVVAREPFSIPFKVEAGKVTYIGEYLFAAAYGENFFGMTVPAYPLIMTSDKQARDVPIFRSRNPEAVSAIVRVNVADVRGMNLPFFPKVPPPLHER